MADSMRYDVDPGYQFQDEMDVHDDIIQKGTFRFIIGILAILVVAVQFTVEKTKVVAVEARLANDTWAGTPATRLARMEALALLSEYTLVDAETGTYRIPIEQAMALEVADRSGN
jgi:hypothetical protein